MDERPQVYPFDPDYLHDLASELVQVQGRIDHAITGGLDAEGDEEQPATEPHASHLRELYRSITDFLAIYPPREGG